MKRGDGQSAGAPGLLPDFCDARVVLSVVLMVQIMALVVALVPMGGHDFWYELAMVSLFSHWVTLTSLATLCLLKRRLGSFGGALAAVVTGVIVILITALLSEAALVALETYVVPPITTARRVDFMGRNVAIAAMVYAAALRYFYIRHQWRRNVELKSQARVEALQARIRPHFLFNSMNTIASLTRSRPAVAEQVVEDLAALFRVTLRETTEPTTLAEELDVCRRYLDIEKLRLGERLRVKWDTAGAPAKALLPALTLQPLVENAVYHGVEPSLAGGEVALGVRHDDDWLYITVTNPLPDPARASLREGNRMARANVEERLVALFGGDATFEVADDPDEYRLKLKIPYREGLP